MTLREAHVIGEELVVHCPLVGERSSLPLSPRSRTYKIEGASDVADRIRHDERSADGKLDEHAESEQDDGSNDADRLGSRGLEGLPQREGGAEQGTEAGRSS